MAGGLVVAVLAAGGRLLLEPSEPPASFDEFWCRRASLPDTPNRRWALDVPGGPVPFFDSPARVLDCCEHREAIQTRRLASLTDAFREAMQMTRARGGDAFLLSRYRIADSTDGTASYTVVGTSFDCPIFETPRVADADGRSS